jgi:transcriptional regulator with XRE-family HTH domain
MKRKHPSHKDWLMLVYRTIHTEKQLAKAIARNIREKRLQAGLTQEELGDLTGRKQPVIARMERQNYGRQTIHSLNTIACALNTTVEELVRIDDTVEK